MFRIVGRCRSIAFFALVLLACRTAVRAADGTPAAYFPKAGATAVCADTPLRLTFSSAPTLGIAGKIQIFDAASNTVLETIDVAAPVGTQSIGGLENFKYFSVLLSGNDATIYPRNGVLSYGKSYYVTVDASTLTVDGGDFAGVKPGEWKFSTKASGPAKESATLAVAADGSGDFCTVQGAVDFIPAENTTPITIRIAKGVYTEMVYMDKKDAVSFVGEDRKQTVIEYASNNKFNGAPGIYHRMVFQAHQCQDLQIANLTIRNTTAHGGSQAEAIILNGKTDARAVLRGIDLYSFQDTLQINGQAYIEDCYIEGDVDFMWGSGPCFFENCECKTVKTKGYFTQIRNPATNHGYVYHHCTFDGSPGVTGNYISRIAPARFPASEVVLIDCTLDQSVGDAAWLLNGANEAPDVHFWEFNSHDAAGKPVDTSKRLSASKQLKQPDDAKIISDYSNPSFVLGNDWVPPVKNGPATKP